MDLTEHFLQVRGNSKKGKGKEKEKEAAVKYICRHCTSQIEATIIINNDLAEHLSQCTKYKKHEARVRESDVAMVAEQLKGCNLLGKKLQKKITGAPPSSSPQPTLKILEGQQAGSEPPQQVGETTPEEMMVARMIVLDGVDPSIINSKHFKELIGMRQLSPITIENECSRIFKEEKQKALRSWDNTNKDNGKHKAPVSLAVGRAKIMEREVVYSAFHFIDNQWKLHKVVLDAYVVVSHMPLHPPLLDVPEVLSVRDSLLQVEDAPLRTPFWTDDLRRSNLFMMVWGILPSPESDRYQHVSEMSKRNDQSRELKFELGQAYGKTCFPVKNRLVSTRFVDQVLEPIARCLRWVFMGFQKSIQEALVELNLTRQERHEQLYSESGLHLDPLSRYDKNWYRTYCALTLLRQKGAFGDRDLIAQDQRLAELLINVFGAIYEAIKEISDPSSPTSNLCLPMLFKVREVLQSELDNPNGYNSSPDAIPKPENIKKCLTDAMGSLEEAIRNSYLIWSVPLVLDPRFKHQKTRSLFENQYSTAKATEMSSEVYSKLKELYSSYRQIGRPVYMDIDSAGPSDTDSAGPSEQPKTDLDKYLEADPVPDEVDFKILDWWKENECEYPVMAHMARGALAMPTCSRISSESEQMAHIKSIIRGYSEQPFQPPRSQEEIKSAAEEEEEEEEAAAAANRAFWRHIFYGEEIETDTGDEIKTNDKKKKKKRKSPA